MVAIAQFSRNSVSDRKISEMSLDLEDSLDRSSVQGPQNALRQARSDFLQVIEGRGLQTISAG
jgi:hypothetical protein